jgi:uncharacterized protein
MNHLLDEKSPYLKQHSTNPIWWHAWGDAAFKQAKAQNKLIFLSIGYSTCHWCHVMEHESFEHQDVADALNANFIAIKVDREERPDVDSIYMDSVQAMTGSGGWPLTVLLTPDRVPFFGGTYFPKPNLLDVLAQISQAWQKTPDKINSVAKRLGEMLVEERHHASTGAFELDVFRTFFSAFESTYDSHEGGRRGAPKFVPSYELRVLLRIHRRTDNIQALKMIENTLDHVSRGGIYDHLAGGFHRYSTDDKWLVPHFEKMLYDQAALVNAYLEAYQVTKNPEFAAVVRQTLDYVLKELTSPEGGFYSAEDADSEGVEGKFYVWAENEIKNALNPEEFSELSKAYGVTAHGNFESGLNILNLQPNVLRTQSSKTLQVALEKLYAIRAHRIRPSLDNKILTSWNGLMISAMAKAARALNDDRYATGARKAAEFLISHLKNNSGHLYRRWVDHEAKFDAYDEDYAFLIDGLIELYQTNHDSKWLLEAVRLQKDQDTLYWDNDKGGYFLTTGTDPLLLRRGKNFFDTVTPSGNSMSILNLLRLGDLMVDSSYKEKAAQVIRAFPHEAKEYPSAFAQMLMAIDYALDKSKEIAIVGQAQDEQTKALIRVVNETFQPNQVISVGHRGEKETPLLKDRPMMGVLSTGYVCINQSCKEPTTDVNTMKQLVDQIDKYRL